ncbi:MAG: hypothetical protein N2C14_19560, partial [Planctomycetales bacterium]
QYDGAKLSSSAGWEWGYLKRLCDASTRSFDWGVTSVLACHPTEPIVAVAPQDTSEDGVRLINFNTGAEVARYPGKTQYALFSRDGKTLYQALFKGEVRVFDFEAAADRPRQTLKVPFSIGPLTVSDDDQFLAGESSIQRNNAFARGICLWNLSTGKYHVFPAIAGAFRPGTHQLVLWANETSNPVQGRVVVIDAPTKKIAWATRLFPLHARAVAVSPDGNVAAFASRDDIQLFHLAARAPGDRLAGHQGQIHALTFNADGTKLASVGNDQTVRAWDLSSGEHHALLGHEAQLVTNVAYSADGRILSHSQDGTVRLWDPELNPYRHRFHRELRNVGDVGFCEDGRTLCVLPIIAMPNQEQGVGVQLWKPRSPVEE